MKKYFPLLVCIALVFGSLSVSAQKENKTMSIGFGLEAGIPVGDIKNSYNFDGGVTLRFSYKAGPGYATFTTGVIGFAPKKGQGDETKAALQIPFKAGYKFIFAKHLFVMGEMGYSVYRYYFKDGNGDLAHASTGGFTYAPSIGANFGVIEIGIKYEGIAISGGTVSDFGVRLGFNF
jgi:hypothetical protein